jgi:non-canonical (house-cleaning) NTP pyrophosphatase
MKAIILSIMSIFGSTSHTTIAPADPHVELEVELAQQEFFTANKELRQAQANFDNAEPDYVFVATEDLNIAYNRADQATRKLRMLVGIKPGTDPSMGREWLAQ